MRAFHAVPIIEAVLRSAVVPVAPKLCGGGLVAVVLAKADLSRRSFSEGGSTAAAGVPPTKPTRLRAISQLRRS